LKNRSFKLHGTQRPPYIKYLIYSLLAFVICGGLYVLSNQELRARAYEYVFKPREDFSSFVTKTIEKDAFKVTVEAKGTIDSSRNSSLISNVEGQTTIISIVPAGTMVKEPLRAKFTAGDGITAIVKEIQNLSSRTPTIVLEERTPKKNDNGELVDKTGKPIVDDEGKPVMDYEKAAYDARTIELPYEMSVYSEVLVEVGDEVHFNDILIGDLVCELDASTMVDAEKQQQIAVTTAKADLEKAEKNVEIQIAQNESDVAAAELQMKLADLDLKKYLGQQGAKEAELASEPAAEPTTEAQAETQGEAEADAELQAGSDAETTKRKELGGGEYEQLRKEIAGQIELKKQELKRAQEVYVFNKEVSLKGYKTNDQVEQTLLSVNEAQYNLDVEKMKLNVLENYTKERTVAELLHLKQETIRNLDRVKLAGEAALVQFQAELESKRLSYGVQLSLLERLQAQIKACRLIAGQPGQVVYANQSSRREQPVVIEEGATVRERQKIINLPDVSAMKVDAKIHESKISDVVASLPVLIRVDAIPAHIYHGVLDTVSSVPLPGNWPNLDLKEYEAVVKILDEGEALHQLKPGMTANVEIIVEESSEKLLQIPVQAAVDIGQTYYAWVMTKNGPVRNKLKLGRSNDVKFVVEGGVKEGDEVIMNPRSHFAEEIAKLEAENMKEVQKARDKSNANGRGETAKAGGGPPKPGDSSFAQKPGPGNGDATAQRPPNGGQGFNREEFFARMDTNGDGELSGDEISDRMKQGLSRIDTNGDGKVSKAEFLASRPPGGGGGGGGGGRPGGPPNGGGTRGDE